MLSVIQPSFWTWFDHYKLYHTFTFCVNVILTITVLLQLRHTVKIYSVTDREGFLNRLAALMNVTLCY
jgi:hypothetical protein